MCPSIVNKAQKMLPSIIPFKNELLSESISPAATTAQGRESAAAHSFPLTFARHSITPLVGLFQMADDVLSLVSLKVGRTRKWKRRCREQQGGASEASARQSGGRADVCRARAHVARTSRPAAEFRRPRPAGVTCTLACTQWDTPVGAHA